jgi:F-type H+-transporting ATPase subunit delta
MTLDRKHKDLTKKLARLSLGADGQLEQARVDAVLSSLRSYPPRLLRHLLKAYLHYLKIEDLRGVLLYEYSGLIGTDTLESLRQHFNQKYQRALRLELKPNDSLLAGLRISIGDDVFEYSASSRLETLRSAMV